MHRCGTCGSVEPASHVSSSKPRVQAFHYPSGVGEREGGGREDVGVGRRRLCSDPTTTSVPPTEMVNEKEESSLSKMLTELNLADKYLHKLESEGVSIKFLNVTLAAGGRKALSEALELLGVDILLHRLEIANELQRMSSA